jgi:hypothetical protein
MWIKGTDALIQTDALHFVNIGLERVWGEQLNEWALLAGYKATGAADIVDLFDTKDAANAAKDWFYLLLTGQINKAEWEQGRTDTLARQTILERAEKLAHIRASYRGEIRS